MTTQLRVRATKRFHNSLKDADKPTIFRELRELIVELERKSGLRDGLAKNIKSLSGAIRDTGKTRGLSIQEWKITKRSRLVFDYSGVVNLIDFAADDTHTAVENLDRLSREQFGAVLDTLEDVSPQFLSLLKEPEYSYLFDEEISGGDREVYFEEKFNEWVRFLDAPQIKVRDNILDSLRESRGSSIHLLIGGPGTGKTMVLVDLAFQLALQTGKQPYLQLPTSVREYVENSNLNIPGTRVIDGDVWLIDDPVNFDALEASVHGARVRDVPIVIGIDPTQWHARRSIDKFYKFLEQEGINRYELQLCYRQGGVIGKKAVSLIQSFLDKSSAFAKEERILAERAMASDWEDVCLKGLSFSDESGHFSFSEKSNDLESRFYLDLKLAAEFESVRNWPKVLIGFESKELVPPAVNKAIARAKKDFPNLTIKEREYRKVGDVRGAEYETVLMLLSEHQTSVLNKGIKSAGTPEWEAATAILTFFTRAQNRLSIFTI